MKLFFPILNGNAAQNQEKKNAPQMAYLGDYN